METRLKNFTPRRRDIYMLDSNVDSCGWLMIATFGVNQAISNNNAHGLQLLQKLAFDTFQEKVLRKIFMKV